MTGRKAIKRWSAPPSEEEPGAREFRALLFEGELSAGGAARILGTSGAQVRSYCSRAEAPPAKPVRTLRERIQTRRSQLI